MRADRFTAWPKLGETILFELRGDFTAYQQTKFARRIYI